MVGYCRPSLHPSTSSAAVIGINTCLAMRLVTCAMVRLVAAAGHTMDWREAVRSPIIISIIIIIIISTLLQHTFSDICHLSAYMMMLHVLGELLPYQLQYVIDQTRPRLLPVDINKFEDCMATHTHTKSIKSSSSSSSSSSILQVKPACKTKVKTRTQHTVLWFYLYPRVL